ncbi:hypothetical protein [Mycolicibacterium llatzerense]|uniref:hypothetical protein n=1 Tax=Mycolicibacterium llatzerense TaxID=280871 RepID=UPI0008DCE69C|nr:hypothetical protein [Mycolicibacterium llatzerense]
MKTYLIVDDDPVKMNAYKAFADHYEDVTFIPAGSPSSAIRLLQDTEYLARHQVRFTVRGTQNAPTVDAYQLPELDGVIADFEIGGRRLDNPHGRIEVAGPRGGDYRVSTGLGVLDWVHTASPRMPLWALTDVSAAHAPLFMSAASLWLDAKPLAVERLYQRGTPLGDKLFAELSDPSMYKTSNPHWEWVDRSRVEFLSLLEKSYSGHESFDWLNALTHLRRARGGFIPALNDRIRQLVLNPNLNAFANTLAPVLAQWQLSLDAMYQDFSVDRDENLWPIIDPDHLPQSLKIWDDFNPITDFLGDNRECQEFFEADDVRMALIKWRARGVAV